jgi:hypothetical protein
MPFLVKNKNGINGYFNSEYYTNLLTIVSIKGDKSNWYISVISRKQATLERHVQLSRRCVNATRDTVTRQDNQLRMWCGIAMCHTAYLGSCTHVPNRLTTQYKQTVNSYDNIPQDTLWNGSIRMVRYRNKIYVCSHNSFLNLQVVLRCTPLVNADLKVTYGEAGLPSVPDFG